MKQPQFWKNNSVRSIVLLPLSGVYYLSSRINSIMADPYKPDIPVICVGNVTTGGAGKTPTALAIASLLIKMNKKPMFLSRGYGGTLDVTTIVDNNIHTARQTGDEPLLLSQLATTVVSKNRVAGAQLICQKDADIIIMDDGLQNPTIAKTLSFLVIDGTYGLGNGYIIPSGPLRETLQSALARTEAVIFIGDDKTNLLPKLAGANVIKATIVPTKNISKTVKYLAFAGLGNPDKFFHTLRSNNYNVIDKVSFPDHYQYDDNDIEALLAKSKALDAKLITTEKDYIRLSPKQRKDVSCLPIAIEWEDVGQIEKLLKKI